VFRAAALVLVCAALAAVTAPTLAAADSPAPSRQVTLIGDSVMTGMSWNNAAIAVMQQGLGVNWQVAVCRRLEGVSCPFQGSTPTTALQLVESLGREISPTVVVEMGYNDFEQSFANEIDDLVDALIVNGADRIFWLTLRETRHPYVRMNAMLAAEAKRHPQLTLIDWNMYSRSHPEWFQNDGEHLEPAGGLAMATLVHKEVAAALTPVSIRTRKLRVARTGRRYLARLVATGGLSPYSWKVRSGRLPKGLKLTAAGELAGRPVRGGSARVVLQATDRIGETATRAELVRVADA
jgi:hypothetical protein